MQTITWVFIIYLTFRKQGISENNEVSPMVEYKSKNQDTVNARLNFQKVERNMDGLYECVAKNTVRLYIYYYLFFLVSKISRRNEVD